MLGRYLALGLTLLIPVMLFSCGSLIPITNVTQTNSPHTHTLIAPPRRLYLEAHWSPDGSLIAASAWDGSHANKRIRSVLLLHADGSLIGEITSFPGQIDGFELKALAWRPDGLLTVAVDLTSRQDLSLDLQPDRDALFLIDPAHWQRPPLPLRVNLAPIAAMDWAPDGQRLLLAQAQGPLQGWQTHRHSGLTVYAPASDTLTLWQYHDTYLQSPRWSPSGEEIMYIATIKPGQLAPEDTDLIVRQWPDSATQRSALSPACGIFEPDWSPNGQRIVYRVVCSNVNDQQVDHLVIAPPDQPLNYQVICDGQILTRPDWGPQGKLLAMTVGYDENRLVVCDVSGSSAST